MAFHTTQVSTVVAAHWMSPEAIARWRSFWGIIFTLTSRPCFLKRPAYLASVSGAKPVHPAIPTATLVSCAEAVAATGADASFVAVPPKAAPAAILEAAAAGVDRAVELAFAGNHQVCLAQTRNETHCIQHSRYPGFATGTDAHEPVPQTTSGS